MTKLWNIFNISVKKWRSKGVPLSSKKLEKIIKNYQVLFLQIFLWSNLVFSTSQIDFFKAEVKQIIDLTAGKSYLPKLNNLACFHACCFVYFPDRVTCKNQFFFNSNEAFLWTTWWHLVINQDFFLGMLNLMISEIFVRTVQSSY